MLMSNSLNDKPRACYICVSGIFYARTLMIYGSVPPCDSVMGSRHSAKSESLSLGSLTTGKAGPFFFGLKLKSHVVMSNSTTVPAHTDSEQLLKELVFSVKMKSCDRFFTSYSSEQISNAFMELHSSDKPFEQILSICETLFDLLDHQDDLPKPLKQTIWQLYKLFSIYRSLAMDTTK